MIEPKPGGYFRETFGEGSDGAIHATVTYARRGVELRFTGPLGFADLGQYLDILHTLRFEAVEGGTRLSMHVAGFGTIQPGWEPALEGVWKHFFDERFRLFVEGYLQAPMLPVGDATCP